MASQLLKNVNLYLVGMMGAGKTTVGRVLAKELGYRFFDTDAVVEQVAGKSVAEIFADDGEDSFRQLETQVLSELSAYKKMAIATGGGIVMRPQNWSYLHHGIVVWLDVPIEQLYMRLRHDTSRPLLHTDNPRQKLQTLLSQRQPLYAQADLRVTTSPNDKPNQVATRILTELPKILRPDPALQN